MTSPLAPMTRIAWYSIPGYTRLGLYTQAVFLVICLFCLQWWPGIPGIATILLTLAAVVMAVRADAFTRTEQVLWVIACLILCAVEMRTVIDDRESHDREQALARDEQLTQFNKIAGSIDKTISNSDREFKATMQRSDAILAGNTQSIRLSQQAISKITGGKSYGIVIPARDSGGPDQSLILEARLGEKSEPNPIRARIHFVEEPMYAVGPEMGSRFKSLIFDGTIDPGQVYATTKRVSPSRAFERECFIDVLVSNGATKEKLEIRYQTPQGNILQYKYQVWAQGGQHNGKLVETTDWKTVEVFNNSVRQP